MIGSLLHERIYIKGQIDKTLKYISIWLKDLSLSFFDSIFSNFFSIFELSSVSWLNWYMFF